MKRKLFFLLFVFIALCAEAQSQENRCTRQGKTDSPANDTIRYRIQRLPDPINSPFSEYSPHLYNDSVFYFSSMKSEIDEDNDQLFDWHWTSRIYNSQYENGEYSNIQALQRLINKGNYYHPNFCFNRAHDHLIFSRCLRTDYEELVCHLYESHRIRNRWQKPQLLGNDINGNSYSSTMPFLAELEDYQVLYFVSNKANGQGGMDIWFTIYKDGKYGFPTNAGSGINTSGDEVTPFYDIHHKTLFFSSDEWTGNGGYDIFKSEGGLSSWSKPVNMGTPLNSTENDIYFCINDDDYSGYFSSNRPVDLNHLEDTCCNDIFRWEIIKSKIDTFTSITNLEKETTVIKTIPLFFDNDYPSPKSMSDTCIDNYLNLLSDYQKKEKVFLKHADNEEDKIRIKHFFEDSLPQTQVQLLQLFAQLEILLAHNDTVSLSIEGYSSNLHNSKYNYLLSSRRIASVMNEFKTYKNGVFLPYINNQQLVIKRLPLGSHTAKKSTDPVYSFEASADRKVVIIIF